MSSQQITVRDIRVAADIGVHAHEIGRRQMLIIAVTALLRPIVTDRLADTVDYCQIVEAASELAEERIALIETFAARLAERCLCNPAVTQVTVSVEKPGALSNGVASAEVVLGQIG